MTARTILRPTGFVASPFGHAGKLARLAGGLNWFGMVELIRVGGDGRVAAELLPVEGIESRFDDAMAAQWSALTSPRAPLQLGERIIRLDQPQVMAILNATPDSFSDGGRFERAEDAVQGGHAAAEEGAAILDVGGESTRPGARPVWEGDEIERVVPVVRQLAAGGAAVSVDTRKAAVMEQALAAGARLINDVSALTWDDRAAAIVADAGVPVVLMHHQGKPETMQENPSYPRGALVEVWFWLEDRIQWAVDRGIPREKIIIDPGFGFGKSVAHNLECWWGPAASGRWGLSTTKRRPIDVSRVVWRSRSRRPSRARRSSGCMTLTRRFRR